MVWTGDGEQYSKDMQLQPDKIYSRVNNFNMVLFICMSLPPGDITISIFHHNDSKENCTKVVLGS